MAVVCRHNDQSLVENVEFLELVDSGAHGVVQLQEIAERAVVIEVVHLLVDRGRFRHEKEALVAATPVEYLDSFQRHFLEARQIERWPLSSLGIVFKVLQVLGIDVAVQPDGKIALAKDAEGFLARVDFLERRLVQTHCVVLVRKGLVVVFAAVGALAGKELLSASTEIHVGPAVVGPAVVGQAVEGLVNKGTVLGTAPGVPGQGNGSGVGQERSRDGAPSTFL